MFLSCRPSEILWIERILALVLSVLKKNLRSAGQTRLAVTIRVSELAHDPSQTSSPMLMDISPEPLSRRAMAYKQGLETWLSFKRYLPDHSPSKQAERKLSTWPSMTATLWVLEAAHRG